MKKASSLWINIIILIQTLFMVIITHHIYIVKDLASLESLLPLVNIITITLSFLIIIFIKKNEKANKNIIEFNLLKTYLNQVENFVALLQSQKHEHTRHIQTVQAMIHLDEIEEAKKYINGIAENYWYMHDVINVGHPALTALLNTKQKVAESKGIKFSFSVKCDVSNTGVESWDLCSILGNLIDNAIEATILKENSSKRVAIEITKENNYYKFYVTNSGPKIKDSEKEKIFKLGYTTKGSEARGYGLHLLKVLVQKYKGNILVQSTDEKTTFITAIKVKGEKNGKEYIDNCSANNGKTA